MKNRYSNRIIPHRSFAFHRLPYNHCVPKMTESRQRWKYTEDNIAEAILEITDNGISMHQAAQRWGVPYATLQKRYHGVSAVGDQIQPHQKLSNYQEDQLASWILRQEALGYAPSHSQIRACVLTLLSRQGHKASLGRNWVSRFIQKRPELKSKIGRRQEANRFDSFAPKAVNWYFNIREGHYDWIKPENTVNVDEAGIMAGYGRVAVSSRFPL